MPAQSTYIAPAQGFSKHNSHWIELEGDSPAAPSFESLGMNMGMERMMGDRVGEVRIYRGVGMTIIWRSGAGHRTEWSRATGNGQANRNDMEEADVYKWVDDMVLSSAVAGLEWLGKAELEGENGAMNVLEMGRDGRGD